MADKEWLEFKKNCEYLYHGPKLMSHRWESVCEKSGWNCNKNRCMERGWEPPDKDAIQAERADSMLHD